MFLFSNLDTINIILKTKQIIQMYKKSTNKCYLMIKA